jgi:hypothetical protein
MGVVCGTFFVDWRIWDPKTWDWTQLAELATVVLAVALVVLFARIAKRWAEENRKADGVSAAAVSLYDLCWMILLALAAIDYFRGDQGDPFHISPSVGSLPTPIIWFGLLGGVMISISGVAQRSSDGSWRSNWGLWHLVHPLVGGVCGVVAVLIFQAGIVSVGSDTTSSKGSNAAYFVIAFVVGYREKTFRDLIKRLADTVFTTGSTAPTITSVTPPSGPGGTSIALTGTGLSTVTGVTFNGVAGTLGTQSDSYVLVKAPVLPPAKKATSVRVVVTSPNGAAASSFTFDGATSV